MIEVYLFDWGDTLMVDFPGVTGKKWKLFPGQGNC